MSFYVSPGQVFSKHCLVALRRLASAWLKRDACRYCASPGLFVWARMFFTTVSYCCVSRGTSHIPVCLFLGTFIISCTLFWNNISCLSSVMVHPSSHKTPTYISGAVYIFGKIWICLDCLIRPGIWSVAMCDVSIVLPSSILAVMLFDIMIGVLGLLISI